MAGVERLLVEKRDLDAAARSGGARSYEEVEAEAALEVARFRSERVPRVNIASTSSQATYCSVLPSHPKTGRRGPSPPKT